MESRSAARKTSLNTRNRSSSLPKLDDFWKRKREEVQEISESEKEIFKKSKLLNRSPTKPTDMDEVIKQLKFLTQQIGELKDDTTLKEIKEDQKEIKEDLQTIKKGNQDLRAEFQCLLKKNEDLQKEYKTDQAQWKKEKDVMKEKIEGLSSKVESLEAVAEKREREERKNNLIVRGDIGLQKTARYEEIKKKVEEICSKEMQIAVNVNYGRYIAIRGEKDGMWLIKMNCFEDKIQVLKNKKKLGKKALFFESDLTKVEREIQWEIRKKAESERGKGNKVKIGYQKMQINGNSWIQWKDLKKEA